MKIVDANIVLRYLLNDTDGLSEKAGELLENNEVFIPNEVIAEIVYVLEKVYKLENREISSVLLGLFEYSNLRVIDLAVINEALEIYAVRKLDFVDTLLYAYHKIRKHDIFTFDKKLNNLLNS